MQEMEMKLQHFSHSHPLIFIQDQDHVDQGKEILCSGCEKPVLGPSYNCAKCKFSLHRICTKLTLKINHPFHRQHSLVLLSNPPPPYMDCLCDFCDKPCNNTFVYHCFTCIFDLHISCALLPPRVSGDFLELQHFSHKHDLVFIENHDNQGKQVCCSGCREIIISGPSYSCSQCDFFLHYKCSNLSPEIYHPYHHEHSLILLTNPPPYYSTCVCDFCHKTCQGFVFHCPSCKFDLDIKCAALPLCMSETENHRHQFIHLMKTFSFICDACGVEGNYCPYLYTVCQVIVHEECRFLSNTVEIKDHCHPITQFYILQSSNLSNHHCGICHNEMSTKYDGYGCFRCDFVVHVNCAVANSVSEDATMLKPEDHEENKIFRDEGFSSIKDIIKEINLEEDIICMVVKHFSHPHKLTLNEKDKDGKVCDCCITPIIDPFYGCQECDFFLHKTCLEWPRKKQHPLHPHPLTLLPKNPNFQGLFFCNACHQSCHGFTYDCEQCDFNLDVRCGSLSNILKHKAHEHPLSFSNGSKGIDCTACGYGNDILYSCFDCNFALDFNCASLPSMVKHKHHKHTLDLTYQDDENQKYCDICEEERNPKHWFYCCKTCNFSAHQKCAHGQYPYIKLGKTYPYEAHPHPVAFVHKRRGHPPCSRSGNPCKGLALECTYPHCNFIIEWCHVEILHF